MKTFLCTLKMTFLGETFKDKLSIFVYVIVHAFVSVVYSTTKKNYNTMASKFDLILPTPRIKTEYGKFICRKGSYDWKVLHPDYEGKLKEYLLALPMFNGVFIDVGANVGLYTIMIGNKKRCKVVAVEPDQDNFKALMDNIELNNLSNKVIPLNIACYSKNKEMVFYRVPNIGGASSITIKRALKTMVKARKLDDILKSLKINSLDVNAMKVDVEGAEKFVFLGAKKLLGYGKPKVFFEAWNRKYLNENKKILEKFGYTIVKEIDERDYLAEK